MGEMCASIIPQTQKDIVTSIFKYLSTIKQRTPCNRFNWEVYYVVLRKDVNSSQILYVKSERYIKKKSTIGWRDNNHYLGLSLRSHIRMLRSTMLADMCMCMQLLEMFQLVSKTKHLFYESRSSCRDYKRCITNRKLSVLTLHRIIYTFILRLD